MGGSSGQDGNFYANQDKLFGAQADIAQNLYNQYASYAPGYLNNTSQMVNEANSGALATRARAQAGADSSQAFGNSLAATKRDMARYGTEFNADRMATREQDAALTGAANKAGAMNSAGQWADDQRWNRNANAYGQIAGMGNGAMAGFGSAGGGYGQMAGAQQSANAANAAGMGKFGSAIGTAMYKADGGYVERRGLRFAAGGPVPMAKVDWRSQPTNLGRRRSNFGAQAGQFVMGVAPYAFAKHGKTMLAGVRGLLGRDSAVQGTSTYDTNGYYSTGPSDASYAEAPNYSDVGASTYDTNGFYSTGPSDASYAEVPNYADSTEALSAGSDVSSAADVGSEFSDAGEMLARGGYVRGLRFARGGNVPPGVASSNPARSQAQSYRSSDGRGMTTGKAIRGGLAARSAYNKFGGASSPAVESGAVSPDMTAAYNQYGTLGTSGTMAGTEVAGVEAGNSTAGAATATEGAEASSAAADTTSAASGATTAGEGTGAASSSTGSAAGYGAAALSLYNNAQQARYYRNDRDGFGRTSPDYRHAVGSAILSYYLKGAGDAVADEIEPVMEPLTRGMIMAGDRIGGAGGALLTDPIGATVSGKYTGEELAKGAILGPLDKYLAQGGPAARGLQLRKDFTPGGHVTGPGDDTSDNIPAWLSPKEYVLNTEAVKLAGKKNLDKLNKRGLKIRAQKEESAEGTPGVKDSPAEETKERRGMNTKRPARRAKRKGA